MYKKTIQLLDEAKKVIGTETSKEETKLDIFYILNKSLDATQSLIVENTIKEHQPDLIIEIPRDACESYEFSKAYEMIEIGKRATVKSLKTLI